jgi:phosphohistidine phosphatase SixA
MGNQQTTGTEIRPLGLTVIEIISLNNLPNMDIGSLTDPYLLLSFRSNSSSLKLKINNFEIKTESKNNNLNPLFHSFHEFPFLPSLETDFLRIKVLDHDLTSHDDKIGKNLISLQELFSYKEITVPLIMQTRRKSVLLDHPTTVTLRLVYLGKRPETHITKTIFLIRHGESKWNISQSEKNLKGMVTQYDHELTSVGIQQAELFHQKWTHAASTSRDERGLEDYYSFLSANAIFSSPLTRALETALITCEGHPAFQLHTTLATNDPSVVPEMTSDFDERPVSESPGCATRTRLAVHRRPLTLLSTLREVKNFGSFDTVGQYSGEEIVTHVNKMIQRDMNSTSHSNRAEEIMRPVIDTNDAQEQWWTALEVKESKADVSLRMKELWNYLRYHNTAPSITCTSDNLPTADIRVAAPSEGEDIVIPTPVPLTPLPTPTNATDNDNTLILVGHSHYFRHMMKEYLSDEYRLSEPEWTEELSKKKLDNASCLRVKCVWRYPEGAIEIPPPRIEEARLVFDSILVGDGESDEEECGEGEEKK